MLVKKCPYCGRISYSASEFGKWICPYEDCKKDITDVAIIM